MKKGKFEIILSFYAVLAFILAFLGMQTLIFLLLGFVILAERDEWTVKQVLQALMLSIVSSIIYSIQNVLDIVTLVPIIGNIINTGFSVIVGLINVIVFIFTIIGILNVSKEKDANIPVFQNFAEWAYGKVVKKVTYQQPVQNNQFQGQAPVQNGGMNGQYQQPMQNTQYQQPNVNGQVPGQAPMNDLYSQNTNTTDTNNQ